MKRTGMGNRTPAEVFPPGDLLRSELAARGWTQADFAMILGRSERDVNDIINAKRSITARTAKELAEALGTSAELWLNLQSIYDIYTTEREEEPGVVARRAELFTKAPVKKMANRGWIEPSDNVEVLERRLLDFFDIKSMDEQPRVWSHAARKSSRYGEITAAQWAWLCRARHLSKALAAKRFTETRFEKCLKHLRVCLRDREECRNVPAILSDAGVRVVLVEALPGGKLDGATFWLDRQSPVVALSFRYDRIDWFWYTLMHELGHVKHGDGLGGDVVPLDLDISKGIGDPETPDFEREANRFASEFLVPQDALSSFIARVAPLFYKKKIEAFARRYDVHPGIVVGQLQNREAIPYSHSRDLLETVRDIVTPAALSDGWGYRPPVLA